LRGATGNFGYCELRRDFYSASFFNCNNILTDILKYTGLKP